MINFWIGRTKINLNRGENTMTDLVINAKLIGVEEATAKAERYVELLKEAKTLADELASMELEIGIKQD